MYCSLKVSDMFDIVCDRLLVIYCYLRLFVQPVRHEIKAIIFILVIPIYLFTLYIHYITKTKNMQSE